MHLTDSTPSASPSHSVIRSHINNTSFDWREYYFAIKTRSWIITLCLIIATLWGVFSALNQKELFTARSVLFIQQVKSNILSIKVEEVRDEQIRSIDMINTLVDLLRSYPFALRVANRLKLGQDRDFLAAVGLRGREVSAERAAGELVNMVKANYRLNTRLIDILVTTRSAPVSVTLANAYAEEYLHYVQDQKSNAIRSASAFLMDESERLRKKMKASEEGMQSFRERERSASIESMLAETQSQLTELSARQYLNQSKLTQINRDIETAKANQGKPSELLRLPTIAGDPKVAALLAQRTSLENELALTRQRYRPMHPVYINIKTQLESNKQQLDSVLVNVVGLLESMSRGLALERDSTKIDRENVEKRLLVITGKSIEYNDLKRELESDTALYNSVIARIKEVDVTKGLDQSPIELQERAIGAVPVGKAPLRIFLRAIMVGLGLGIGMVLVIHKLDTSIKTVDQIEQLTGLPVVAAIPRIGGNSDSRLGLFSKHHFKELSRALVNSIHIMMDFSKPLILRITDVQDVLRPVITMIAHPQMASSLAQGMELVVKDKRSGIVAESFRSLRASIAMNARVEKQRIFLITSAHPSEGKSFCSSNFAVTLAQQGLKTLLIDADLRKPSISRIFFGMNRKPGLSEVLHKSASLLSAITTSNIEGLSILTAGGLSSRPSELLAGQPMRNLLAEGLKTYDRIVIDSAPLLAVSDTLLIAPNADVVCLVVRSFITPRRMVLRAIKALGDIHIRPEGIVFNSLPSGNAAYYTYYYSGRYSGSYGSKGVYGS